MIVLVVLTFMFSVIIYFVWGPSDASISGYFSEVFGFTPKGLGYLGGALLPSLIIWVFIMMAMPNPEHRCSSCGVKYNRARRSTCPNCGSDVE